MFMEFLIPFLQKCPLFCDLPLQVLIEQVLPYGKLKELSKDEYIIMPQDRVDKFGIIILGNVHLLHMFHDGNYSILSSLDPHEIIGIDLICTKNKISPYYAVSTTKTQILFFPSKILLTPGIIDEPHRLNVLNHLLTLVSHENMKKFYRFAILSQNGLRARITTYLTMQANKAGSSTVHLPFSREEFASFLCVNRSALSHELSLMQQEGIIRVSNRTIMLLDWHNTSPHEFVVV